MISFISFVIRFSICCYLAAQVFSYYGENVFREFLESLTAGFIMVGFFGTPLFFSVLLIYRLIIFFLSYLAGWRR